MLYTMIYHQVRNDLNISPFAYFVLDLIHKKTIKYGNCSLSQKEIAAIIFISDRSVKSIYKKLLSDGLIEIDGYKNTVSTEKTHEVFNRYSKEKVKKVHQKSEESSPILVKKVPELGEESSPSITINTINKNNNTNKESAFGNGIILPVEMYKVMRSKRPDIHIEPMATPNETTSLIALSKKIRNTITEGRKQKGHPASASKNDIITYFTNLVNNLPDYVFEGRFKPVYLNNHFTDIVKGLRSKRAMPVSRLNKDLTYKPEKKRK